MIDFTKDLKWKYDHEISHMWLSFPQAKASYRYAPIRFLEREFGIEYTTYENKRIAEIHFAIRNRSKELSGYVVWLNVQKAFLIVPTLSCPQPRAFCEIPDRIEGIEIPPQNAFISARGSWKHRPSVLSDGSLTASLVFHVEQYKKVKPEISSFKPDIDYHDFREILFESLQNVDYSLQDLIAHSFISSPKTIDRVGGSTLSYYNESKGTSRTMLRHLRRYLPKELAHQEGYQLSVEEIGHSIRVDPFPLLYKQYNADANLANETINLLERRSNTSIEEASISLRSEKTVPKSLNDPPVSLSDVPIVASKDIESSRGFFDPSPEIFKFMIATHMVPITISGEAYQQALEYLQEKISQIASSHPTFLNEQGKGGMLDLNIHGKPLSLLHIALSNSRSNVQKEFKDEAVNKAFKLFETNINNTLDIWTEAFPGEDNQFDFSWLAPEQRRIVGYLIKNGPSTPEQAFSSFSDEMSHDRFVKLWCDMYEKRAIYEKDINVFEIVPSRRQI